MLCLRGLVSSIGTKNFKLILFNLYRLQHVFEPEQNILTGADEAVNNNEKLLDSIEGLVCVECVRKNPFLTLYSVNFKITPEEEEDKKGENEEKNGEDCKLEMLRKIRQDKVEKVKETALWVWPGWRDLLCHCKKCTVRN